MKSIDYNVAMTFILNNNNNDYRSFRRRFYESDDPTNSVTALKDDG